MSHHVYQIISKEVQMNYSMLVMGVAGLLVLGCQEGSTSDSLPASTTTQLNKVLPVDRVIPLIGSLANPGKGSRFIEIDGELAVSVTEILGDCPWTLVEAHIQARAELKPAKDKGPVWMISASSKDEVLYEVTGHLVKRFVLQGRSDGMILHINLDITDEDVTLDRMWLELPSFETKS
jgi:hypothetical protein